MYAVIPIERKDEILLKYEIPVGGWIVQRVEANRTIKTYIGLEELVFKVEQSDEIINLGGQIFPSSDQYFSWWSLNGVIENEG